MPGGRVGVLVGKEVCFRLTYYHPTHTTHTYTYKYGASFSVALGVVQRASSVCVLLQRAFTNDKACLFSIASHFRYRVLSYDIQHLPNVLTTQPFKSRCKHLTRLFRIWCVTLYGYAVTLRPNTRAT